jgi:Arc/MetJ-type ribon-helix-helix transcriptional regulator
MKDPLESLAVVKPPDPFSVQVDELVERRRFRNRSQAVEAALGDKLQRLARDPSRPRVSQVESSRGEAVADEGLAEDLATWPEY